MTDLILDSKFRVLESLPKVSGRQRFLVSDLISSRIAMLEYAPLEGFERVATRWSEYWLPALRERAARFAGLASFVPLGAVGAWTEGPYYVYECIDEEIQQGQPPHELPELDAVRQVLLDLAAANALGEHVFNLRPEYVHVRGGRLQILPGAYVLPLELLVRSGARSPYQPPELRHAGHIGPTTDGYQLAAVLGAIAERGTAPVPGWMAELWRLQALEPGRRLRPAEMAQALVEPVPGSRPPEPPRRGVDRLSDLRLSGTAADAAWAPVVEALDGGVARLAEGRSTALVIEGPASGAGLVGLFLELRERLSFLTERPRLVWLEALTAWEARDLAGTGGLVVLAPDYRPAEPEMLPLDRLLGSERLRPALWVVGVRRGAELPAEADPGVDILAWIARQCGADVAVRRLALPEPALVPAAAPISAAARHLVDLLSILEADATWEMLRQALPQQEANLPEAVTELEQLGYVRRVLEAGGWWGTEARLVLRGLRPEALTAHRERLTAQRREELHLLVSHLLENLDARTLPQRYLRFHHLFAGGNWDAAAVECGLLLKGVQKRGLDRLVREVQRKLVNSNLALHFTVPRLLEVLRSLGNWEVERGRLGEGQSYYERAAERLFVLGEEDSAGLDLEDMSAMLLAHAELLERRGEFERALDLLQRYVERFDERLPAVARGRLFSEMSFCEDRLGRFAAAEERCHLALKLLDARRNPAEVAQVYSTLGTLRWKASRYDEAEQYLASCLALREKTGDKLAMARTYNNLGLLYRSRRRFPEALEFHRKSMEMRQALGDEEGVARNILNLAWVHFEMANLEHAEELASRACRLGEQLGTRSLRAKGMGLLGEIYLARDRIPEARQALEEAIRQVREVGDVSELFMDLRKQASLELRCGDLDHAAALLQEAERYLQHAASPLEEAHWYLASAELKVARGDPRAAALAYEHAGNNLARLAHARAAEVFLSAARLYHDSGVAARARDLVGRARQLYGRDGVVVIPKALVDLEAAIGARELPATGAPEAARLLESLCRVTATAASGGSDVQVLEQILAEMRALSGARCAVLVGRDGEPHRASALPRETPGQAAPGRDLVLDNPRLVERALQTLLPFGSEDLGEEQPRRPFYVIPVEARENSLGCVLLEWPEGARLPEEAVLQVLRAECQQAALVLERGFGPGTRAPAPPPGTQAALAAPGEHAEASLESIVGRSAARQTAVDFVRQVRDVEATVLIMGENGTGKEVVARAIHYSGARRQYGFITINCTAIPEALWEREMFGHERGAFTDAHEAKRGFFETAHRGSLLLDEIGDMPWEMQTKFLRVLEDKSFTRIGGSVSIHADVRIVAATNQDLEAAVQAGRFRRDLYHRLNVLSITLPPLRERREDIPELAKYFLELHAGKIGMRPKRLSGEALRILMRYPWPGNVRELENAIRGSMVLSDREVLVPEDLPAAVLRGGEGDAMGELDMPSVARWILDHAGFSPRVPLMPALEKALARQLVEKLGEKTQAARLLGISKPTLYSRLK